LYGFSANPCDHKGGISTFSKKVEPKTEPFSELMNARIKYKLVNKPSFGELMNTVENK
jgi:hypothetical protein